MLPDCHFIPQWIPMLAEKAVASATAGPVLVLSRGSDRELAEALAADERAISHDTESTLPLPDDVGRIYFLAGVGAGILNLGDSVGFQDAQEYGVFALLRLVKHLAASGHTSSPLELRILTQSCQLVHCGEIPQPCHAALSGLAASVAKEFPSWRVWCVDIGPDEEVSALVEFLRRETGDPLGRAIAVRHGRRYVRTFVPWRDSDHGRASGFRHQGVYLIIGGLGTVGLEVARHLSATRHARLVLVSRREPTTEQRGQLEQIAALGGTVMHVVADVADEASMRKAVAKSHARFGALNGVFHAALDLQNAMIVDIDEATFAATLRPKLLGSVVLSRVLRQEKLDFLCFFSSIISFAGSVGQCNYAAGSTFQDAFARAARVSGMPVRLINWGVWAGLDARTESLMVAQGLRIIDPATGMRLLERVIAEPPTVQVMCALADPSVLRQWGVDHAWCRETLGKPLPSILSSIVSDIPRPEMTRAPDVRDVERDLGRLGQLLLLAAWRQMGVFGNAHARYRLLELQSTIGLIPACSKLFDGLISISERAGFVRVLGEEVVATEACEGPEVDLAQLRDTLARDNPGIVPHLRLLWHCVKGLPDVLCGRATGTEVLFPDGSTDLVEGIYQGESIADGYNALMGEVVARWISRRRQDQPSEEIRILEVGAGTGSASAAVLDRIGESARDLRYWFTDIFSAFFEGARRRLAGRFGFIEFESLDLERDLVDQGHQAGSMDIVLAFNVLHATRNILYTLRRLKALLKPNGLLIVNEITRSWDFGTLTFGLTAGWWVAEDPHERLEFSPLLSERAWKTLLADAGFGNVHTLEARGDGTGQCIFVAESDGVVIREVKRQAPLSPIGPGPSDGSFPPELIAIHPEGRHLPSFWVHGAPGLADGFGDLSSELGPEYPVFAFQARGIDGASLPFADLKEMAAHYTDCLRLARPEGPVVLGGHSLGGVIALEMARQLHAEGRTVAHLVLLDSYPNISRIERVFRELREQDFYYILSANLFLTSRGKAPLCITASDLAGVPSAVRLGELVDRVCGNGNGELDPDEVYRHLQGMTAVCNYTGEALRDYMMEPYRASNVLYFRAARGFVSETNDTLPRVEDFRDLDYLAPWRELIREDLVVVEIDADHHDLLSFGRMRELRRHLAPRLASPTP
jgi:thioesterase domain-containing protein/SAM-dependent methyltransferase/NADP-dependent 3-hydroxy acid dehydrogenase YdfG